MSGENNGKMDPTPTPTPEPDVRLDRACCYTIHAPKGRHVKMDDPMPWLEKWISGEQVMILIDPQVPSAAAAGGMQQLLHAMKCRFGARLGVETGRLKPEEERLMTIRMIQQYIPGP